MLAGLVVRIATLSLLAGTALLSCAAPPAPTLVRAEAIAEGADSRILEPTVLRIRSNDELRRAWNRHRGRSSDAPPLVSESTPQIDFDRWEVVAIFGGGTSHSDGIRIVEVVDVGRVRRVRFDSLTHQTAGSTHVMRVRRPAGAEFGFFLLPRTEREVVVEENVQNLLGAPPVWELRDRV